MIRQTLLVLCVVFTIGTLASCMTNLAQGRTTDTYLHIIDRAVLTFIGVTVLMTLRRMSFGHPAMRFLVPYGLFITLAFAYVFVTGFIEPLHPDAYRDVFLNDTIAYGVVYGGLALYDRWHAGT